MSDPTVTVNGTLRPLGRAQTLSGLLEALGVKAKKMAVELNGEIVPRSRYAATRLSPGDRLEIVGAVGGG